MAVWERKTCDCDDMDNLTIYFLIKISTRQSSICNHLHHKYKWPLLITLKGQKKTSKKQWHLYFDTIIILKVLWNSIILCMWFVYQEVKYVVLETTV